MFIGRNHIRSVCRLALVGALVMIGQVLLAQSSGSLKGRVLDNENGGALIGANVVVANTSLGAATDIEGKFTIHGIPTGTQTIKISYIGYKPISVDVTITENGTVEQDFQLTAQAVTGQTVVVTAQARGQLSAINQELSSTSIINVVSAEKMKELPDANIAESIGRLPGISLQRDAGEADAVIVRGLSPKYNNVTIEGVPMVSTYFGDRGIDLSLLSDDLVQGVEVSKTLRPDMDADALGGTVNLTLKTAQQGLHYDLRGNGGYTKLDQSYKNYKVAGTVGDRFADDNIGLLIQGNIEEKQLPSNQFNAAYAQPQGAVLANGDTIENLSTQSATLTQTQTRRNRYGASAILDYTSDFFDVKLYSVYDQKKDSSLTRSNQTTFLSGQFFSQIFANETKTEQWTHSAQFLFKFGGTQLPVSLAYTRGDVSSPNGQQIDIYGFEPSGFPVLKLPATNFVQPASLMNYNGVQQPANSLLQEPWIINNSLHDKDFDAKVDWKVPFRLSDDFSGTLSTGGKYHSVDRTSDRDQWGLYIQYGQGAGARNDLISYLTATYPGFNTNATLQTGIEAKNFVDPNYTANNILGYAIGQQYNADQLIAINKYFYSVHGPSTKANEYLLNGINSYNQDYTDKENSAAGYFMGEFNVGSRLTVIPGARFQQENTDITSYHLIEDPLSPTGLDGKPVPSESKRNNPYWFPSVNIKYKATDKIQIFGAAYRSVSLPSFTDINPVLIFYPSVQSSSNGSQYNILGGNPLLKPSTATNFDLGATISDNNIGLFTVNLFYKQISDLIYSMQNYQPFLTSPIVGAPAGMLDRIPSAAYYDTTFAHQLTGAISTNIPLNDPEEAYLRGIELSWQTHMWYLPWVLSGIVLDLNASFMSSNQLFPYFDVVRTGGSAIKPINSLVYKTRSGELQNQPKAIYNAILGWDYKGFSSRFSLRYTEVTLSSLDTRYSLRDAYYDNVLLLDISLKQQLIDNLAIFADVTNVNNHIDTYYLSYYNGNNGTSGNLPTSEQTYGLDAQVGLSFSY
ncbi:MAG TPA: TonB-dependent receptor [Bacteroidota bacterium]|nr:TonB-dependent receptor [Bacteroidota bacterium]